MRFIWFFKLGVHQVITNVYLFASTLCVNAIVAPSNSLQTNRTECGFFENGVKTETRQHVHKRSDH